ncbi:MAG: hypothetical protein ACRDX9_00345 [Acidimicrobiia bacterium]
MTSEIGTHPNDQSQPRPDPPLLRVGVFGKVALGVAGGYVGMFWFLLGALPIIDLWHPALIDLTRADFIPLIGGLVLVVWSFLGAIRPTKLRFIPPAIVAFPIFMYGLFQWAGGWGQHFTSQ